MPNTRCVIPQGYKNGYLQYLHDSADRHNGYQFIRMCRVRCVCGKEKDIAFFNFYEGNSRSCGCKTKVLRNETRGRRDLEMRRFRRELEEMAQIVRAQKEMADKAKLSRIKALEESGDVKAMMDETMMFLYAPGEHPIREEEEVVVTVGDFFVFEKD